MTHRRRPHAKPRQGRLVSRWVLLGLMLSVVILSSLAFTRPIAQNRQAATATDELPPVATESAQESSTEEEAPPTAEEIGYTDGIIFCSSILVLILLVGTLRETFYRRKQQNKTKKSS
jgi:hypothetical protein